MIGNTNLLNSIFLNQYKSQMNNGNNINTVDGKTTGNFDQQKAIQQMVFQAVLSKIMDGMGSNMGGSGSICSSIATQALINNLQNTNSLGFDNALSLLSNFNSTMRGAASSLSKGYNNGMDNSFSNLGIRASKYESDLNPGEVSDTPGDYGGKSYGAWQFSAETGSLESFINSLKGNNNDIYSRLTYAKAKDGNSFGENFDATWKSIARENGNRFLRIQQNYVKENFYDVASQILKSRYNFDINGRSNALKESLWSTVVQHGVGGATSIFSKLNLNNSDGNIINDLYNERQNVNVYFRSSSPEVRQSVYNRFTREKQDMLNMLSERFV